MSYYDEQREKNLKALDMLAIYVVFAILFALCGMALVDAIDKDQEQNLLSPSERVEVVSRWKWPHSGLVIQSWAHGYRSTERRNYDDTCGRRSPSWCRLDSSHAALYRTFYCPPPNLRKEAPSRAARDSRVHGGGTLYTNCGVFALLSPQARPGDDLQGSLQDGNNRRQPCATNASFTTTVFMPPGSAGIF